jgi:murein L,D-transpeptidase YcbB/YkuD
MLRTFIAPSLLALLLLGAAPAVAGESETATPQALKALLAGDGPLQLDGRAMDRALIAAFYDFRGNRPLWIGDDARIQSFDRALAGARAQGLDPEDFAVPKAPAAERELLFTDAFLRYAQALAQGRVNSAAIESDWSMPVPRFDAATELVAVSRGDPEAVLKSLEPAEPQYERLIGALAQYRALAARGGWRRIPLTGELQLGDSGAAVERLGRRLAAEDFLADDRIGDTFDGDLDAAVRRFQAQHGIAVDGTVGPATYAALNVPVGRRVEQIRDNLERWRELPRRWPKTRIEVNAPAAWLTVIAQGQPGLSMRAIVGAADHPTPVVRAWMSAVLFNPPWTIPDDIAKKEILPRLKRDPHYLARNHFVYVGGPGRLPLRQLPGPDNALGRIKFEVSDVYDVYLHDTSSHPLFSRVVRALSHGCVRLEEPRQLALYVLGGGKPAWSLADIDGAIAAGDTRRVELTHGLPVYLLYWTAFVDPGGAVEFRDDIYGRDLRLAAALEARHAADRLVSAALGRRASAAPLPGAKTAAE